jgi:hypothetical protein
LISDQDKKEEYGMVAGSIENNLKKMNLNADSINDCLTALIKNACNQNTQKLKN